MVGRKGAARRKWFLIGLVVASVCGIGAWHADAQTAAGEITGLVHDQAGAAVPGATITVTETRDESAASGCFDWRWRLHRGQLGTGRLPPRSRAVWVQARAPRGHPFVDRREGARRLRPRGRRRSRTGDRDRGRADCARGDRKPRHRCRERAGGAAAAERPPVHHARRHRTWRRSAAELRPASHQRRETSTHEYLSRTNLQRVVVSTGDGVYTAASLAPGEYRLDVELAGLQARAPRRHPSRDRREGAHRFRSQRRRHSRTGDGRRRRADRASGDREPRDRRRERAGRAAAAERPPVHHARRHRAGRRPAAEFRPAAHQRRETANERVSLRRHLRAAARAGAGGVLPDHRRHPGVQDREQQPAGRVRAVQWRRGQSHDEIGHQCLSRQRVRVFSQRAPERQELLPDEQSGETGLPAESVRRHVRRPPREGPDVLLCRLSGSATEHRPHGDLERAHARRTFRCLPPEHLRSGDDGGEYASAVSEQHDSEKRHGSGRAVASRALPAPDQHRHREQLQPDGQRNRRSGSGRCAHRSQVRDRPRSGVRTVDVLPWSRRTGDGLSGRERDHPGRQRGRRSAGYDGVGVCVELSAHLLDQPAERSAHRRYAAIRPAERGVSCRRLREPRSTFPASRRMRSFPTRCRPSRRTATSSSDRRRTRPRTSAPASRRSPIR